MKLVVAPEAAAQILVRYFEVFPEGDEVWILAARGANQRGRPKL